MLISILELCCSFTLCVLCMCFQHTCFFRNSRLLNSKEFFLQNFLKKISGSFYRCLIFKVRSTFLSRGAVSMNISHFSAFVKNFFRFFLSFFQNFVLRCARFVSTPLYYQRSFHLSTLFFKFFRLFLHLLKWHKISVKIALKLCEFCVTIAIGYFCYI